MQQEQSRSDPNPMPVEGSDSSVPELPGFLDGALSFSAWEPEGDSDGEKKRDSLEQLGLSRDDLFKLLANPRRRYVLYYLTQHATEADLGTLATQIAAWENNIEVPQVNGMERKRVYTSLQQVHLPKMDDAGIVGFDKRSGVITPKASLTELEFGKDFQNERPWYRYYAVLSAGNISFVALTISNIWPLGGVSNVIVLAWILISYMFLTLAHMATSADVGKIARFL